MTSKLSHSHLALFAAVAALAAGCGGGSDEPVAGSPPAPAPPTAPAPPAPNATGRFIDSEVIGLDYNCAGNAGVTNSLGQFQYVTGQSCTFSVGGITLGSGTGAALMYPVSLVPGAQPGVANAAVSDIARLLLSLDDDANPANGIVITQAVRTALAGATLNAPFGSAGFAAAAQTLVSQAIPGRTLVSTATANGHLDLSLVNLWSGGYQCKYYADVNGVKTQLGNVAVTITEGVITGAGTPIGGGSPFDVNGNVGPSGAAVLNAASGSTSTGASFSGSFRTVDGTAATTTGSGTWSDPGIVATGTTWDCQHT